MIDGTARHSLAGFRCPLCGGDMQPGFILTKQARPRWSSSLKGATVFTGTPLTSLPRGFWLSRSAWRALPLQAARCERCGIGVFRYDREVRPLRSGKRAAAFFAAAILCAIAFSLLLVAASMLPAAEASAAVRGVLLAASGLFAIGAVILLVRSAVESV